MYIAQDYDKDKYISYLTLGYFFFTFLFSKVC